MVTLWCGNVVMSNERKVVCVGNGNIAISRREKTLLCQSRPTLPLAKQPTAVCWKAKLTVRQSAPFSSAGSTGWPWRRRSRDRREPSWDRSHRGRTDDPSPGRTLLPDINDHGDNGDRPSVRNLNGASWEPSFSLPGTHAPGVPDEVLMNIIIGSMVAMTRCLIVNIIFFWNIFSPEFETSEFCLWPNWMI